MAKPSGHGKLQEEFHKWVEACYSDTGGLDGLGQEQYDQLWGAWMASLCQFIAQVKTGQLTVHDVMPEIKAHLLGMLGKAIEEFGAEEGKEAEGW